MTIYRHTQGQGETVVVLHGWGLNHQVWQPIMAPLAESHQLIAIDLPGFGRSDWPTGKAISFTNMVALVSAEIPAGAHLIGWSLGGLIASAIALQQPRNIASLTTIASSPKFQADEQWPGIDSKVLDNFHLQLQRSYGKTIERFLAIQAMGDEHARAQVKWLKPLVLEQPEPNLTVLDQALDWLADVDLRAQLPNISVPLLRYYGRLDSLVPNRAIAEIDKLVPKSAKHVDPQASHAPFISNPQQFIDRWLAFTNPTR